MMMRGSMRKSVRRLLQHRHQQCQQHLSSSSTSTSSQVSNLNVSNSNKNATAAAAAVTAAATILMISSSTYPGNNDDRLTACSNNNIDLDSERTKSSLLFQSQSGKGKILGTSSATIQNAKQEPSPTTDNNNIPDDYPTFTKYHRSLLAKHLTPSLFQELKNRRTSKGVTLEQIIQSGTSLPTGCDPPRGLGVLAGDAESYKVFAPLLDPIIREYHGLEEEIGEEEKELDKVIDNIVAQDGSSIKEDAKDEKNELRRKTTIPLKKGDNNGILPISNSFRKHTTNINSPHLITKLNPDPTGDHILSVRIAVSRSIDGYSFPSTLSRSDRRSIQSLVRSATTTALTHPKAAGGVYVPIYNMTNSQNEDLIQRNILFDNPVDWYISAGLSRDWPDGRGVYLNVDNYEKDHPTLIVWCNAEDHMRIIGTSNVGDIRGLFTTLSTTVRDVERFLVQREKRFAYDDQLGFLTSCPSKVGTALQARAHVKLIRLGQCAGFEEMVKRLKLNARLRHLGDLNADYDGDGRYNHQYQGLYGGKKMRYTGIFDVSNAESLGKSEVQLINVMIQGVAKLIELECKLEKGEKVDCTKIGWD